VNVSGRWARPFQAAQEATARGIDWAQPWADGIARIGYLAKGAVLLMVGGLALFAAMSLGGKATDPYGALLAVGREPAGRAVLISIALGSLAHALFRGTLVVVGEPYAEDWRGGRGQVARRLAYAGSALVYMGLAGTAAALGLGWRALGHHSGDVEARRGAGQVLHLPFGRSLLGGIAAGILLAAAVCAARAFGKNDVRQRLRVEVMTEAQCRVMEVLGRVAYLARATVLGIISYFLARAAYYDASPAARGPGGALRAVAAQAHGDLLLGILSLGLIAAAVYVLLEARWRRMFRR
jgi:hypothetical protein